MKAIISNGKRTQVFSNQLQLDAIKEFTSANFPRMKNPVFKFKDSKGELVSINSNSDIQALAKLYQGQNFVQIQIFKQGKEGKGQDTEHHGDHHKNFNRVLKRQMILQKIYGASTQDYQKFIAQNQALSVGKLIKKFAEDNGILKKKEKKEKTTEELDRKIQRKRKVLEKIFGVEEKDKQEQFLNENKELRLGQLIKKYSEINGIKEVQTEEKKLKRKERILQKLSVVLEKPKEDLLPVVEKNPECNFRQLLKIFESQKGLKIDSEKLKKHHQGHGHKHGHRGHKEHSEHKEHSGHKERKERKERKEHKKQHKFEEKEIKVEERKFTEKIQTQEQPQKEKILKTMQGIFQTEQPAKLMKFIEQNYALGEAGIVQKWLNK